MAHGAPDHTRLSDDAFSHYEYNYVPGGGWALLALERRSIVDIDLVGIFGIAFALVNNKGSYFRIEVDGREVFELAPSTVFTQLQCYNGKVKGVVGSTIYDEVNDKYSIWYHTDWKIYVHKHLKVEVWNFTINPCTVAAIWCEYAKYKG